MRLHTNKNAMVSKEATRRYTNHILCKSITKIHIHKFKLVPILNFAKFELQLVGSNIVTQYMREISSSDRNQTWSFR